MGLVNMYPVTIEELAGVFPELGYCIGKCLYGVHLRITGSNQVIFRVENVLHRGSAPTGVFSVFLKPLLGVLP